MSKSSALSAAIVISIMVGLGAITFLITPTTANTALTTSNTVTSLASASCTLVPCPTFYPPGNTCTFVNYHQPPYLLSISFPRNKPLTLSECQKILPSAQLDLDECNQIFCNDNSPDLGGAAVVSTMVFCEFEYGDCLERHGTREYRCPGASEENGNMCVCTPCGIAMLPVNAIPADFAYKP